MPVALDELRVKEEVNGVVRTIQALDPSRVEDIQFLSYVPPPTDSAQLEEWGDRIRFIAMDLHKLLRLSHDKFWCQAIFDESLQSLIDTYLKNAPRSSEAVYGLPEDFQDQHDEVHRMIFMTCLRLATHKEDKDSFITPAVFGEILYENFIFDIPKLFDICVLFGPNNEALLSKMINNIFTQQPKYYEDLSCAIPTIYQAFEDMKKKCGMPCSSNKSNSPQKLHDGKEDQTMETLSVLDLQDLILYIADIGVTLSSFVECHPAASQILHQTNFIQHLSESYDIVPALLSEVKKRDFENYRLKQFLRQKVAQAKKSLMKTVHLIIYNCYLEPILENRNCPDDHVDGFIETLSAVLNERRFLADFESCFPFQYYMDILTQSSFDIDETRIHYIQDAFSSAFATFGKRREPTGATTRGGRTSPDGSPGPIEDDPQGASNTPVYSSTDKNNEDLMGACAPVKTGVELDSMIAAVKDLLPDLGDGFIELCLEEAEYDIEKVINFVLEDKLPLSLQKVDRNLPREVRPQPEESAISHRASVFDHDEFDVFSKDKVDMSLVYKGKREKTDNVDLNAKDLVEVNSMLSKKYGYEKVYVEDSGDGDELYDDEYDDTYDTINVGADDADSADELSQIRPFTVPRVLKQRPEVEDNESEESSDESDKDAAMRDSFVPNPALIRQRAEERAQWKNQRAQGQKSQSGGQAQSAKQDKKYDVKGGPKGKGQAGEVLKNRAWKEKHKSSRANHNRKYFSDKKRMA